MARLEVLEHNTVYRNPESNRVSEYVAFPSILALADDTLLCMCRHGSARESDDGRIRIHRSTDGGRTWTPTAPLPEPEEAGVGMRLPGGFGATLDADVLAWVAYPAKAKGQRRNYVSRSADGGVTWSPLVEVDNGPFVKMAPGGNLATLPDGTIVAAGESSGDDVGTDRWDWTSLTTRSADGGRTWEPVHKAHVSTDPYFFDLRITGLGDGRLLGAYWTHDMVNDQGLNVHTTWSSDAGRTWTTPQDAHFWGQVTDPCRLRSGRVIAVTNHRRNPLGIRALLSEDDGASFDEPGHVELWGVEPAKVRSAPVLAPRRDGEQDIMESYHHFTFGTPSVTQLSDGTIVVAFYVTEEHVTYVRCCRVVERK